MSSSYPKIKFFQYHLKKVNEDNTITVEAPASTDTPGGGGIGEPATKELVIKFDVLVLCTGFTYEEPIKNVKAVTLEARKRSHKEFYEKIEKAKSILLVGGGVVGIELAGELAVKYGVSKEKKIGICVRGERLLPGFPTRAGRLAEEYLRERNVKFHYKTPYTEVTS